MKRDEIELLEKNFADAYGIKKLECLLDFIESYDSTLLSNRSKDYKRVFNQHKKYYHGMHKVALLWQFYLRRIPFIAPLICKIVHKDFEKDYFGGPAWWHEYVQNCNKRICPLKGHREDFVWIYNRLEDERSRLVLCYSLIRCVLENNKYARAINDVAIIPQYFDEDIVCFTDDEVFVDMGGVYRRYFVSA